MREVPPCGLCRAGSKRAWPTSCATQRSIPKPFSATSRIPTQSHIRARRCRICLRQPVEAALLHQARRRLLPAAGAMGRRKETLASLPRRSRHRLVGSVLWPNQFRSPHRPHLRRLPLSQLQHRNQAGHGVECGLREMPRPRQPTRRASNAKPTSSIPRHLDSVRGNDICIQCHSQGQPLTNPIAGKYYDWPVGFVPGQRLADYWKLEELKPGVTNFYQFADMTAHKNRMQGNDFVQSTMYHRQLRCFDCHQVHSNAKPVQPDRQRQCALPQLPHAEQSRRTEGHRQRAHASRSEQRRKRMRGLPHAARSSRPSKTISSPPTPSASSRRKRRSNPASRTHAPRVIKTRALRGQRSSLRPG